MQKLLQPFIDKFLEGLSNIKKQIEDTLLDKEKELQELANEREEVARRDRERQTQHELALQSLKNKEGEFIKAQEELNKETLETRKKNEELEKSLRKQQDSEKIIDELKKLEDKEYEKQKALTSEYQKKIDVLQLDYSKLDEERKKLSDDRKQVFLREQACLRDEGKNAEEQKRLGEWDIDLQTQVKRIELEIKRRNLNVNRDDKKV